MKQLNIEIQNRDEKGSPWRRFFDASLIVRDRDAIYRIDTFFQINEGVIGFSMIVPTIDNVIDVLKEHNRCGNFWGCHVERINEAIQG